MFKSFWRKKLLFTVEITQARKRNEKTRLSHREERAFGNEERVIAYLEKRLTNEIAPCERMENFRLYTDMLPVYREFFKVN
jgi:sirohydrochlorin ferrochelatase